MFWTIVIIAVSVYIAINIAMYYLQERFLFKPEKLSEDFEFNYDHEFTEHNLDLGHGVNINGVHFSLEKPRGVVFYLKGNSRSIKGWGKYATDFKSYNHRG